MKTNILLPVVLIAIIAILGGALIYERYSAAKKEKQFVIVMSVEVYQCFAHGNSDEAKQFYGALASIQSEQYEEKYGKETDTKFASWLAQAKEIKAEIVRR